MPTTPDADRTLRTLRDLVAVPSVGGSADEVAIQHVLAQRLGDLGLTVDLWPLDLPALRADGGYPGEEVGRDEAWGLVAENQPGADVGLVLSAHVDVVPSGDLGAWSGDPFTPVVSAGRLVGRGACDMKGGLAAILAALEALGPAVGDVPPFAVHCVIAEEDGGLGAFASLARGHTGRACVIPEPTGLQLVTANAGSLTFRIEVPGVATHGSTAYAGVSAIDAYLPLHAALARLAERRNRSREPLLDHLPVPYPLSVGRLRAGDWASSVPDRLVAEGRYGLRVEEDPAVAVAELEATVAQAAAEHPFLRDHAPVVTWPGGRFLGGHLPPGHPLAGQVAAAHAYETDGEVPSRRGAPWGSDLRLYSRAGIPTLHYGPGDVRLAHGPDENVPLDEVMTTAAVFTRLLHEGVG
ncbi:MAG TPA: ArgE/DapE family deacylase [Friedmanniella sp.]